MGKRGWVGLVLVLGFSVGANANEKAAIEELKQISHQIAYINSFGTWREGAVGGSYRVILMDAKEQFPHSKIFLQWIEQSSPEEEGRVVAMAPVVEINNVGVYKLSVPRIVPSGENSLVELTAINQYSQVVHHIQLLPQSVGRYQFRYTSKPYSDRVDAAVGRIPLNLNFYVRPTF